MTDARAKARRFLIYRAWKAADDPMVSPTDIARVTGMPKSTVASVLTAMGLPHASVADAASRRDGAFAMRQAVDRFMETPNKNEARFAYFGD